MSKESKIAKKEMKAAKKAAKLEKQQAKQYAALVASIEKKNAKAEKKAAKKGKPFVPTPIPTPEEAAAAVSTSKGKKIVKMIILILLIIFVAYFLYMLITYVAPVKSAENEESSSVAQVYDRYVNEHLITTTKTYTVAEAKALLKQTLHDNWKELGYSSDPSSDSINSSGSFTVNNVDCYGFTAGGKTYAVAMNLSAIYQKDGSTYKPVTFHETQYLQY